MADGGCTKVEFKVLCMHISCVVFRLAPCVQYILGCLDAFAIVGGTGLFLNTSDTQMEGV